MLWSGVYTGYSIHSVLHHPMIDCLPLLASVISRQTLLYSIFYFPTITSHPMNRVSAPAAPPSQTSASRLTASLYSSNLARSRPPSGSPKSLDYGLQPLSLTARMFTWSWPPSVSLNSLGHDLGEQLWVHSIWASKWISKYTRLRPPSLHHHVLEVHLETRFITASKCILKV